MNNIIRFILATCFIAQTATAAQLLDVRTGETDRQSRMVLVSDVGLNWSVAIDGNELVMQTAHVQTSLPASLMALKAQALGKIKIHADSDKLVVRTQLKQAMRIVATKRIPAKGEQSARWLVDLEPVSVVRAPVVTVAKKENPVAPTAVVAKVKPVISPAPIPAIVVENALLAQTAKPTIAMTQLTKNAQSDLAKSAPEVVAVSESLSVQPFKGTRALVVAIDAGHGGKDVGATSASGALEKDLTLAMAKALKQQIDAQPGMRAVLTRDEDFFIPLGKRPRLAREMGADIFISLHADTYKDSKISGASFYVMSWNGATSQLAKFVAAHSNSADSQSSGLEPWNEKLANQIGKLAMESSIDDSHKLADFMQKGLKKTGIKLQHNHVQAANFVVLKNIDMPSVLVEMGFISNPQQDKLLQDTQYQQKMAASITKGLVGFVQVQPEPGVVYAKLNVVKGDSLASIAERHGTSVAYLARANSLTEKSTLKVGQQLRVPVTMSRRMAMVVDSKG
jgi:N-acetylmuramoyl-L-alanine amidase